MVSEDGGAFSARVYTTEVFLAMAFSFLVYALVPNKVLKMMPAAMLVFIAMILFAVVMRAAAPADSSIVIQLEQLLNDPPDPDLLQVIFLPPILFADCLEVELPWFYKVKWQMLWLIIPVLLGSSVLIGIYPNMLTLTDKFTFVESIAIGALMADTDPVAVLLILESMGGPDNLQALLGSESLFNDAISIIVVKLMLEIIGNQTHSAESVVAYFCREVLVAIVVGVVIAVAVILATRLVRGETVAVVILSLTAPYLAFALSLYHFHCSGIIAVVVLALMLNKFKGVILEYHMQEILKFWRALEFIAGNLFFAFIGALVGSYFYEARNALDWLNLFYFTLWVLMARAVLLFISMPIMDRIGPKLGWKQTLICVVGSMRGAVTMILAIAFHKQVTKEGRMQVGQTAIFLSGGVIFAFLLNILILGPLCKVLGLSLDPKTNPIFMRVRENIRKDTFSLLSYINGGDVEKARYLLDAQRKIFSSSGGKGHLPQSAMVHAGNKDDYETTEFESEDNRGFGMQFKSTNIQELRCIFHRSMHESFLSHLNGGLITPYAYFILQEALEWRSETGDHLLTWDNVTHKGFPFFFSALKRIFGNRLDPLIDRQFLIPSAWAFLVAHERARQSLHKLLILEGHSLESIRMAAPPAFVSILAESERCSLKAAIYFNRRAKESPERFTVLKALQARFISLESNLGIIHDLKLNGITSPPIVHALQHEAKKIHRHLRNGQGFFTLNEPVDIGLGGTELLQNANFAPFLDEQQELRRRLDHTWTMSHTFRTSFLLRAGDKHGFVYIEEDDDEENSRHSPQHRTRFDETLHILSEEGELSTNNRLKALVRATQARVVSESDTA